MPINFIPNDPLAPLPMRAGVQPRPERATNRAGFHFFVSPAESEGAPGTSDFLFWQCRQAILTTVDLWERLDAPVKTWSNATTKLNVLLDAGNVPNAEYDPISQSLVFYRSATPGRTMFSGASTDVVAHECGHALLEAMRPELRAASPEFAAFHEAFGDCMSLLVALSDLETRRALLAQSPDLSAANFVEALMEDLADAVKRLPLPLGPSHSASEPRHALNTFAYQLPMPPLPRSGGPSVLTSEPHSFSRVFTGCFYDLIRNLFTDSAGRTEDDLLKASTLAGTLLLNAARTAPIAQRLFQSVGRAMVLADDAANGGVNRASIGRAFAGHGILLGANAALMPAIALRGPAMRRRDRGIALPSLETVRDLKRRLGAAPTARISFNTFAFGFEPVVEAVHLRKVSLDKLGRLRKDLKGVVAVVPEGVVLGASGGTAAVLGALPDVTTTEDEVLNFVETLLENDSIQTTPTRLPNSRGQTATSRRAAVEASVSVNERRPTFAVVTKRGERTLERVRYRCGCCVSR